MTNIRLPNPQTFQIAKQLLEKGEVIAFPTETVYGLGANALDRDAVSKIFTLKKRPANNPLIVHVGCKEEISTYGVISNDIERTIIDKLMPGPITILIPKKENILDIISPNDFVGIRIPSNKTALELLQTCKLPIAAPSANISTKPSPTSAEMVYNYFGDTIPLIINGGSCDVGIESTVVKVDQHNHKEDTAECSYTINILRPGFITKEDLEHLFSKEKNISIEYNTHENNLSPGVMYKHYAPRANIEIIHTLTKDLMQKKVTTTDVLGLILTQEYIQEHEKLLQEFKDHIIVYPRGSRNNLFLCAKNLFDIYSLCDTSGIKNILIEQLEETGLGYSIMNRVKKSAEKGTS